MPEPTNNPRVIAEATARVQAHRAAYCGASEPTYGQLLRDAEMLAEWAIRYACRGEEVEQHKPLPFPAEEE